MNQMAVWDAPARLKDGVDIVVGSAWAKNRLKKADRNWLQRNRDKKLTSPGLHAQVGVVAEETANVRLSLEEGRLIKVHIDRKPIRHHTAVNRMLGRKQRNAIAYDG